MKKIISAILSLIVAVGIVTAAPVISSAATIKNSVKSGKLIKCGKYFYGVGGYYGDLIRVTADGKKLNKKIDKNVGVIHRYKNKIYYSCGNGNDNKVKMINGKNNKITTVFKLGSYMSLKGVYKNGFIVDGSDMLYVKNFKGKTIKKLGDGNYKNNTSYDYAFSNDKYIFYIKTKSQGDSYEATHTGYLMRYSIKSKKTKQMGKIGTNTGIQYSTVQSSHVYGKSIIFTYGTIEGSMALFSGACYTMNPDGTKIRKKIDGADEDFIKGQKCVYIKKYDYKSEEISYKITSTGKVSKVSNSKAKLTVSGKYVYKVTVYKANEYPLKDHKLVSSNKNGKKVKTLLKPTDVIKATDPSGTHATVEVIGEDGNCILVKYMASYYSGNNGWRDDVLRNKYYFINVKTGKKVLVKTV